jgi:adenylate kinase family enzyme
MIKIAFLLGRPGGGKSTVSQLLETTAQKSGWVTRHIYDYKHLHDLFQQEIDDNVPKEERSFCQKGPEVCQGFDVLNFKVLDTVLKEMADEVRTEELKHLTAAKLLLIEFARKEYCRALDIFGYEILNGAHLLYVKLDLENCIKRVRERADVHRLRSEYDHFVSEDIMRGYYGRDDWSDTGFSEYLYYLQSDLVPVSIKEIDNSGTYQELEEKVDEIVNLLLVPELATVL